MKIFIGLCFLFSTTQGIDLFEDIIAFKEDIINGIFGGINDLGEGVFGKGKCGCPCRDYSVPKCEIQYVEQCHYDHYEQVCESIPVPVVIQAKEIECQKCQKYKVAVPKTKWVKECNPVYDEKCSTEYHQHCKEETRCHVLYQTVCDNSGYQQHCGSQPRQHCYPETKCHRTPETQCVPVQKQKCEKVPVEVTDYVTEKQCLPFELDLAALNAQYGDPCASYQVPQGHHHHDSAHQASHSHHHGSSHDVSSSSHQFAAAPNTGYNTFQTTSIQNTYQPAPSNQYQQPAISYGVSDPILQHQPVSNHYEVKRENLRRPPAIGNDNPFLRRPKTLQVSVKRLPKQRVDRFKDQEDPRKGWVPIPRPVYKR